MATAPKPPDPIFILRGHDAAVHAVEFAAEDSVILSGDVNGLVNCWNVCTRRVVASLPSQLQVIGIHRMGSKALVHCRSGEYSVCDLGKGGIQVAQKFSLSAISFCKACVIDENHIAIPDGEDSSGGAVIWDIRAGKVVSDLVPGPMPPPLAGDPPAAERGMLCSLAAVSKLSCADASGGVADTVVAGYESGNIVSFNTSGAKGPQDFGRVHKQSVLAATFAGNALWTACPEEPILCNDIGLGKKQKTAAGDAGAGGGAPLGMHDDPIREIGNFQLPQGCQGVNSLCTRPDQRIVAAACWDGAVRLYSAKKPQHLATLQYHSKPAHVAKFGESEGYLATGSDDCRIAVYKIYPPKR